MYITLIVLTCISRDNDDGDDDDDNDNDGTLRMSLNSIKEKNTSYRVLLVVVLLRVSWCVYNVYAIAY